MSESFHYQPALAEENKEGNKQALLNELFEKKTRQFILGSLRRKGFSPEDADDIAQTIISKANKAIEAGQFNGRSTLKTWLNSITRNEALNFIRARNARPIGTESILPGEELEDSAASSGEDYISKRMETEEVKNLMSHIDKLPPRQKQIIQLQLKGKKVEEIAAIMEITEGAVKSGAFHARNFLRESMEKKG